jgi:hypothetical protein
VWPFEKAFQFIATSLLRNNMPFLGTRARWLLFEMKRILGFCFLGSNQSCFAKATQDTLLIYILQGFALRSFSEAGWRE